jgi:hypothetical protein
MATALGIAALAVGIGSAAYAGVSSAEARSEARSESERQQRSVAALEKEFADRQTNLDKSTAGKDARERQKKQAAGAVGRRDTILTGPAGLAGDPTGAERKTLLGL